MKLIKLFTVLAVGAMTTSIFAADAAKATIKVQADGTAFYDEITIATDAAAPADMSQNNNVGPKAAGLSPVSVNVWAEQSSKQYANAILPNLNGLVIKFKANAANTAYTLTLSNVEGGLKLFKGAEEVTSPYAITCAVNEEITFTVSVPYTRELAANAFGTICYPEAVNAGATATIYELTYATETEVYGNEVTTTTAGKAYVFKAIADGAQLFTPSGAAVSAPVATTGMGGTFVDTTVPAGMYGIMGSSVVEVEAGNALLANRAYIDVETLRNQQPQAQARKIFTIVNTPTGMQLIEAAPAMKEGKMILNGQMVIIRDGKMFNAQGAAL